jgi:hypothetical protein
VQNQLPSVVETSDPDFDRFGLIIKDILSRDQVSYRDMSAENELDLFLTTPLKKDNKTDIFLWWYIHRKQYPQLYRLAGSILIIPASSATSERVFSASGYMTDKRRIDSERKI